jgi:hypothetical protein
MMTRPVNITAVAVLPCDPADRRATDNLDLFPKG